MLKSWPLAGFEWDEGNSQKNRTKHGIDQALIESVFLNDPQVLVDARHSKDEPRYFAVGKNAEGRWMFVSFTLRSREQGRFLRPISARYMHQKELKRHAADPES